MEDIKNSMLDYGVDFVMSALGFHSQLSVPMFTVHIHFVFLSLALYRFSAENRE